MTGLRTQMKALGLAGGLLFNRDKTDADGQVVAYKVDNGTSMLAQNAFKLSMMTR